MASRQDFSTQSKRCMCDEAEAWAWVLSMTENALRGDRAWLLANAIEHWLVVRVDA